MVVTMTSKDDEFANRLSREDRNSTLTSIVFTLTSMVMKKNYSWEKEGRKFIDYCDLMSKLREDRIELMYGPRGIEFKFPVYVRSVNELDKLWTDYCSAELENSIREHFTHVHSPLSPLEIAVRIDDYNEGKKKFESAEWIDGSLLHLPTMYICDFQQLGLLLLLLLFRFLS